MLGVALAIGGSALLGYWASQKAADAQLEGVEKGIKASNAMAEKNLSFQQEMADEQRADFAPWRESGQAALTELQQGMGSGRFDVGEVDVTQDPSYQFRMDQGIEARDKSAASRGRLQSGAQSKGIEQYAQNFASNEYNNAYNRQLNEKNNAFNRLNIMSQGGQAAAGGQAAVTGNLASTSGNIMANQGNAQNIAANNTGAVRAGAYQDTAQIGNQAAQNWLTYNASQTPEVGA